MVAPHCCPPQGVFSAPHLCRTCPLPPLPHFEVNNALLSRARVFVLEPLSSTALKAILRRALRVRHAAAAASGAEEPTVTLQPDALQALADLSNGDARVALNSLEMLLQAHCRLGCSTAGRADRGQAGNVQDETVPGAPTRTHTAGQTPASCTTTATATATSIVAASTSALASPATAAQITAAAVSITAAMVHSSVQRSLLQYDRAGEVSTCALRALVSSLARHCSSLALAACRLSPPHGCTSMARKGPCRSRVQQLWFVAPLCTITGALQFDLRAAQEHAWQRCAGVSLLACPYATCR